LDNVAHEVAVCTNGNVWIRGTDNKLYYRSRITEQDQKGQEWVLDTKIADADVTSITCGKAGQFAMVQNKQVVIKNEISRDDPAGLLGGTSTLAQGNLEFTQVSIGEQGQLYALSSDNQIYVRRGRSDSNLVG